MERIGLKANMSLKNNVFFIVSLAVMAFFMRVIIGTSYFNAIDLMNFNKGWMESLSDGLFDVYARNANIDYPPVFLMLLYPFSGLIKDEIVAGDDHLMMLLLKIVPIIFDTLIIPLLWFVFKDKSPKLGIMAASLWAINASGIINSTLWGQTDAIMAFMLILCFYLLENGRCYLGGIFFALACVTKYQSLYFAPVVVLELITRYRLKKTLLSVVCGIAAGAVVFLPFMIGSGRPLLVGELYFGGFDKYNYGTLNAYNFYGVLGLNGVETYRGLGFSSSGGIKSVLDIVSIGTFGWIMMALSVAFLITLYLTAKKRSIWIMAAVFMELIFMMTTRMHERYQFIVVPFCLVGALMEDDIRLFISYILLTVITCINQAALLIAYNGSYENIVDSEFGNILTSMSVVNIFIMLFMLYSVLRLCYFGKRGSKRPDSDPQTETQ